MLGFHDESGISEKPVINRTWALKGQTPVIHSTGSWKGLSLSGIIIVKALGNLPRLFLKIFRGSIKSGHVVRYLKDLKRQLRGKKLLLIWDGLPAHRSKATQDYAEAQRQWLRLVRFPSYAPELNPIEYLWSAMKRKDLANLPPKGLLSLRRNVYRSKRRLGSNQQILKGFLKASGLYP